MDPSVRSFCSLMIRGRRTSQKLNSFTEFPRTILKQVYLEIKAIPHRKDINCARGTYVVA
jgi:hypothetical protein